MCKRPNRAIEQRRGNLGQQLAREIRPANWQLVDVDSEVRNVLPEWPQVDTPIEVEVPLAEFEKPPEWLEHLDAALHRLAAQRVEDNVDPLPGGELAHGLAKREVSRIKDVIGTGEPQE